MKLPWRYGDPLANRGGERHRAGKERVAWRAYGDGFPYALRLFWAALSAVRRARGRPTDLNHGKSCVPVWMICELREKGVTPDYSIPYPGLGGTPQQAVAKSCFRLFSPADDGYGHDPAASSFDHHDDGQIGH